MTGQEKGGLLIF